MMKSTALLVGQNGNTWRTVRIKQYSVIHLFSLIRELLSPSCHTQVENPFWTAPECTARVTGISMKTKTKAKYAIECISISDRLTSNALVSYWRRSIHQYLFIAQPENYLPMYQKCPGKSTRIHQTALKLSMLSELSCPAWSWETKPVWVQSFPRQLHTFSSLLSKSE